MGPSRARDQKLAQDGVSASSQEKDDRIASLEARLEAYSARASTAQTRLLKTIDVLDALRSQHALEMSAEEQTKTKLAHEVDRLRTTAKNLEAERDELKDVVEDLIEKAGCTSLNTQRGNLNVEFSEQVAAATIDGGATKDNSNELLAYATSIVARLRMELDFERQSHSKTVEEANLRIEELEAKVAVREAELERCITSSGDYERHQPGKLEDVPTRGFNKKLSQPQPLSDEECLRFLESNNARNRSLEIEIRRIAEKLEQVKIAGSPSSGSREQRQSPVARNDHEATSTFSPRTRSASVDPNTMSRPLGAGNATPVQGTTSPSTKLSIVQLDNQISALTTHVDALVSERTTLIEAAAIQRRATDCVNIDAFQDILRVEAECIRLQAEVDDLREQLQHARAYARSREKAFLREIAQLRASSPSTSAPRPAPDLYSAFSPKLLEDDIAADESMELASPLLPTVFPTSPHRDAHAETDLVLFPFSPKRVSLPVPATPSTPPRAIRRDPGSQDIERVQVALDDARMHLAQKEEALTHPRAEMEKLQLEVRTQDRPGGDGDRG